MLYSEVPAFFVELRERDALAARAFEVTLLRGLRTKEVLQVPWAEIDLESEVWIIPGHRMKAGRPHKLPLLGRTLEIFRELCANRYSDFVFPGQRPIKPLSNMAMQAVALIVPRYPALMRQVPGVSLKSGGADINCQMVNTDMRLTDCRWRVKGFILLVKTPEHLTSGHLPDQIENNPCNTRHKLPRLQAGAGS